MNNMNAVDFKSKNPSTKNKLFLTCPVSRMEPFIKDRYGWDGYFLTALGAVFNFQEINYSEALRDFLERKAIEEIYIVNDTSCPFIKSILEKEKGYETDAERVMLHLLIDNYSQINAESSMAERQIMFATLNLRRQALEIISNDLFRPILIRSKISVTGLLTTKEKGWLKEVNVNLQENYR